MLNHVLGPLSALSLPRKSPDRRVEGKVLLPLTRRHAEPKPELIGLDHRVVEAQIQKVVDRLDLLNRLDAELEVVDLPRL